MQFFKDFKRKYSELTKKVLKEQAKNPLSGDFYSLVKNDLMNVGKQINEQSTVNTSKRAFKTKKEISIQKSYI